MFRRERTCGIQNKHAKRMSNRKRSLSYWRIKKYISYYCNFTLYYMIEWLICYTFYTLWYYTTYRITIDCRIKLDGNEWLQKHTNSYPPFSQFTLFVTKEADIQCNPVLKDFGRCDNQQTNIIKHETIFNQPFTKHQIFHSYIWILEVLFCILQNLCPSLTH